MPRAKQSAGEWAAKQKYPFSRAKVRRYSQLQLAEMREVGIEFVGVLGCNNPGDDCEACLAMKGRVVEIASAAELPLPGCTMKYCKCILLAERGPAR